MRSKRLLEGSERGCSGIPTPGRNVHVIWYFIPKGKVLNGAAEGHYLAVIDNQPTGAAAFPGGYMVMGL
jgi:hypothetical protein